MKWNEITWYSQLATIIICLGAFPVLCFFIGVEYAETASLYAQSESIDCSK